MPRAPWQEDQVSTWGALFALCFIVVILYANIAEYRRCAKSGGRPVMHSHGVLCLAPEMVR